MGRVSSYFETLQFTSRTFGDSSVFKTF